MPFGANSSAAEEETQMTRTVFGGADLAVEISSGVRSLVNINVPRQLVPSWSS